MKQQIKQKSTKNKIRSPTLQTVLMVEKFINENSGEYTKTQLFQNLPKKVMWQTFQVIMGYLRSINKIVYDQDGNVVYIWNPEIVKKFRSHPELKWNA